MTCVQSKFKFITTKITAAAACICTMQTIADLPTYDNFQLQARSNIVDGFNLPSGSSFNSGTPVLNDSGQVAIRLVTVGTSGQAGLWFGEDGFGTIVYTAPPGPIFSDPSMNASGQTIVEQSDTGGTDGVFLYDPANGDFGLRIPPGGTSNTLFFSTEYIADDGSIAWRSRNGSSDYAYFAEIDNVQVRYVATVDIDPASPYSFLFSPSTNNALEMAGKVRLGNAGQFNNSQPDEIRIFQSDGSSTLIAADDDGDPKSPYTGFDNSISLNDNGQVAFITNLASGGRGVFVSDGNNTTEIATTNNAALSAIDFFPPSINNSGIVAFRGKDAAGLDAVFVGDGQEFIRLIGEHDLINIDLGTARIDQHDNSVTFGGAVDINNNGDVAFQCTLTPENNNQVEWGSGLFIAYADNDRNLATLTDVAITFGTLLSGDITELQSSDDVYLTARSAFGFLSSQPNVINLVVDFVTDDFDPDRFILSLEGKLNNPGGTILVSLRNFDTNQRTQVAEYAIGIEETTAMFSVPEAGPFVDDATGNIELTMRQFVVATFSLSGFIASYDLIEVEVQ